MALLRAHLPPNAILVGQNIQCDVQWLQLAEGVDYHYFIGMLYLNLSLLKRIWRLQDLYFWTFVNLYRCVDEEHCHTFHFLLRAHHANFRLSVTITTQLYLTYIRIFYNKFSLILVIILWHLIELCWLICRNICFVVVTRYYKCIYNLHILYSFDVLSFSLLQIYQLYFEFGMWPKVLLSHFHKIIVQVCGLACHSDLTMML